MTLCSQNHRKAAQISDVHISMMILNTHYVSIEGLHPLRAALLPDYMIKCSRGYSLHFLDLKAAPGGSFVSQHFLKCVVTWLREKME